MLYSLVHINQTSPYQVCEEKEDTAFFITDNGIEYLVGFIEETNLEMPHTYQMFITRRNRQQSIGTDPKIAETIAAIVSSFFKNSQNILVYLCDTSDRHEAARHRKFSAWYRKYADSNLLQMHTESISVEDNTYFASIIFRKELDGADIVQDTFHQYFQDLRAKLE